MEIAKGFNLTYKELEQRLIKYIPLERIQCYKYVNPPHKKIELYDNRVIIIEKKWFFSLKKMSVYDFIVYKDKNIKHKPKKWCCF